jgi:hypothetical protein
MRFQLRDDRVIPGEMEMWVNEWTAKIRPLREQFGFEAVGAWTMAEHDRFLWILAHDDFEAADGRYYASAERRSRQPDPARHLASADRQFLQPV